MATNILLDRLIGSLPIVFVLVVYFISLERRVSKIQTDICWIKKYIAQQTAQGVGSDGQ